MGNKNKVELELASSFWKGLIKRRLCHCHISIKNKVGVELLEDKNLMDIEGSILSILFVAPLNALSYWRYVIINYC